MSELLYQQIDPKDYLKLAEELSCREEATAKRTAADRAYYAAFLTSRDILLEKGYVTLHDQLDDHSYICSVLKSNEVLGSFGNQQNRLRLARNSATYNTQALYLGSPYNCRRLTWMFDVAKKIIKLVEELPNNPKNK